MAVHLCAALAFVHDQGLIHADLKPENVVQIHEPSSPAGLSATVKLVDFGNCIERRQLPLYEAEDAADDSGGFDIQTLAYRAPEVAMGVAIAPAMDLWSLGCLLVECATGCPLFGATTVAADGTSQHSLTNAVELIEQIEWLLTGGVPLGKSRPLLYGNARHYKFRAEQQQAGMVRQARLPRQHERATVARYLPLRHRLQANRPETAATSEWIEFQEFAERLLDVDPTTRLTARAAFLHPFLQKVFPFQFMFAPEGSPFQQRAVMIDTSPSDEESDPQQEQQSTQSGKKKRTNRGREDQGKQLALARGSQKKKRHVSGSLRHALELIPKPSSVSPPPMVVKQEPSTRSLIGEILEEKKARYRRKVYNS
jgi:serine/threonine protein kinase